MKTIKHKITGLDRTNVDHSLSYNLADIYRIGEVDFEKLEQLENTRKARIEHLNNNQGRPLSTILKELGIT